MCCTFQKKNSSAQKESFTVTEKNNLVGSAETNVQKNIEFNEKMQQPTTVDDKVKIEQPIVIEKEQANEEEEEEEEEATIDDQNSNVKILLINNNMVLFFKLLFIRLLAY